MTFQESDLEALKEAYTSGATSITINGRTVVFQTPEALEKIIQKIEEAIAAQASPSEVPVSPRTIQGRFTRK